MSTGKKPKTGGEIDAYCTKCKLDLTHRIIAMVGDAVKKVECKTCGSHHLYRRPKSERDAALARLEKKAADRKGTATKEGGSSAPKGERLTHAERVEREQTAAWEHAIAGQPVSAFRPYRFTLSYTAGELIRHSKFGDGVVARVIDRNKIEVLFKEGPRTLAHGMEGA